MEKFPEVKMSFREQHLTQDFIHNKLSNYTTAELEDICRRNVAYNDVCKERTFIESLLDGFQIPPIMKRG